VGRKGRARLNRTPAAARRFGAWAGIGLSGAALVLSGCTSSPSPARSSTTGIGQPPRAATSTTTTTTTAPPTSPLTSAPSVQSGTVSVTISGASAGIRFVSSSVTGSLSPGGGAFSQGGTVYTFTITGVQYTGTPVVATASGGLIVSVAVAAASAGVNVSVKLSSPASHASLGLGHDQVGVQFS